MINAVRLTLSRSPRGFARRSAEPIPATAGHGSVHYLLAALSVVMLTATLSVVPIPNEAPLVGNLVDRAMADHQQRCTTTTVTEYHPTRGSYTTTRRTCTTIDHPKAPSNLEKVATAVLGYGVGSLACGGFGPAGAYACGGVLAGGSALVNEPEPYVPPQTGPPCLPGCATKPSSSGTSSGSGSSGSGHPSGGTG